MSFMVVQPGMLSLLQDAGRFGQHHIGLTNGGPLDPVAFRWANRLLGNAGGATAIEVSFGGLQLEASVDTQFCFTGADMPLTIDGTEVEPWTTHRIQSGQRLELGFAEYGCRGYLAVRGGFTPQHAFGSSATVIREGVGGLNGDKLAAGDTLPCKAYEGQEHFRLAPKYRPHYGEHANVRVIPGYQQKHFPRLQQRRFFHHAYEVSQRSDRMGYRLEGPAIECDIDGILSEGICQGAIQVPADGQPIVLLNDRQTIGGYPKIGSALSLDVAALSQLRPGGTVWFSPISIQTAHNALHLAHSRYQRTPMEQQS